MDSRIITIDRRRALRGMAAFGAWAAVGPRGVAAQAATPPAPCVKGLGVREQMRKLWEEHITWTRLYIVSFAADLPDQDATATRLLQNQVDIGDAIRPFYGDAAGTKLTALLKAHILGAVDVVKAAKTNDSAKLDAANAKWYANADEIAVFLNGANPNNWPLADLKVMMKAHLDLTEQEAVHRLNGDFAAGIKAYDAVEEHILMLADLLGGGIIAQFPEKFA